LRSSPKDPPEYTIVSQCRGTIQVDSAKTVLVVEDDPLIGAFLVELLALEDFRPLLAPSIEKAREILEKNCVDLVVTDLWCSSYGEKSWEPVAELRSLAGGSPIMVCTGHREAAMANWPERGVSDVIVKPVDLDYLVRRIQKVTGRSH
jgi:DNA-binding NtrC family response regulator